MYQIIIESITNSINSLLSHSMSEEKIRSLREKHEMKPHFIPIRYRILGGVLQSMNIQFGNFLEGVIAHIVASNPNCEVQECSGLKKVTFRKSEKAALLIDEYINNCQDNAYSDIQLQQEYTNLIQRLQVLSLQGPYSAIKHDVDLWFYDKQHKEYVYCEIKYNDDHDTGKYVDINRKFLLTYSLLLTQKGEGVKIKPYLFYFTKKKMKGNIYVPETEILRENAFFERYTLVDYKDIDEAFKNISESAITNRQFDDFAADILKRKIIE